MNEILIFLAGIALGARFDNEVKAVVPILDPERVDKEA